MDYANIDQTTAQDGNGDDQVSWVTLQDVGVESVATTMS